MRFSLVIGTLAVTAACSGLAVAQPPEGRDGPHHDRLDGVRDALDAHGDHKLDADEIKNAAANLAKADKNGDGTIDHEEFRPPLPPIPRGPGGFRGPPPREGGPEGRPRRDERGEGGPPREGRPPREAAFRGEDGPRPEGGPSPERFVERAMTFDADGDGKLDRTEMEKFAGEVMQRMRSGMMAGRGFREGEGPRRRSEGGDDRGERPERPRRPE